MLGETVPSAKNGYHSQNEGGIIMTQEPNANGGILDMLVIGGMIVIAALLYVNDPRGGDDGDSDGDDWPDDLSSSYPPEEDAMNHRYPGSYGSKTGG